MCAWSRPLVELRFLPTIIMGNLLGKDKSKAHKLKADQLPPKDKAVYDLKLQRDKLKQYQKKVTFLGR